MGDIDIAVVDSLDCAAVVARSRVKCWMGTVVTKGALEGIAPRFKA